YVESVGSVGADFRTGDVDFIDMNGDALPDVVNTRGGVHRIYEQRLDDAGAASFAPVRTSAVAGSGALALSAPEVQLMDLDGDGFIDVIDGANDVALRGTGTGDWSA